MSADFDLAEVLRRLDELERDIDAWPADQREMLLESRALGDALQREAWRRLLQALHDAPGWQSRLRELAGDEVIYAALRRFGLLKASLDERIALALAPVRPLLHAHGGDVEIVEIRPPDTVLLRMTGACDGCPASAVTLTTGVVRAIRSACPEITTVQDLSAGNLGSGPAEIVSPFAGGT